ncbi:MAG: hypothetical protein COC09_04840 [Gammaproteobacteria bacterium]|nr:MAG: hypothetical protein COC09_04840 [Gammaproteobacteria bacterium]
MFTAQHNKSNYLMIALIHLSTTNSCARSVLVIVKQNFLLNGYILHCCFDFNNDGTFDTVVLGTIITETNNDGQEVMRFAREAELQGAEPDLLGVYFNARDVGTQPPDLVRIRDTELRLQESAGLLTNISLNDYRNTDILVFREATGELVVERRGFRDEEVNVTGAARIGLNNQQRFFYNIVSRGPSDTQSIVRPLRQFEDFNARNGLTESFRRRGGNFLRPGETVRIVAINRATGYIGTARTALNNAITNSGGAISILVPDIVMRPPNLKVWAIRDLTVEQGLTQGEDRSFTIGTEGAALTSDTTVRILTEWLDHDGSPLPQGLTSDNGSDFGYTGRLARIVAAGTLGGAAVNSDQNSDLAEFPIRPGLQTQAITVASNLTRPEHYYVHVIGMAENQDCLAGMSCPDFETPGSTAPFDTRPRLLTPFMVPLFDEQNTFDELNAFNAILRNQQNQEEQGEQVQPNRPLPSYVWQYRPEYQFSQYDLEVNAINLINEGEESTQLVNSIIDAEQPTISSSDDIFEIIYSLFGNEFDRLAPINGEQEFILAFGGEESLVRVDENQTIHFDNLAQLSEIDANDLLALRLYTNNDAGNILYEYAFGGRPIPSLEEGEFSADDQEFTFAVLTPFSTGGNSETIRLQWMVDNGGGVEQTITESSDGIHDNIIRLNTISGTEHTITVQILDSSDPAYQPNTRTSFGPFTVRAGEPASIEFINVENEITLPADGTSNATLVAMIRDQFGNQVEDGTTAQWGLENTGELSSLGGNTTNGLIQTTYVTGNSTLPSAVSLSSSNTSNSVTINKTPLDVSLAASSLTAPAFSTEPITLTLSVSGSDSLDGQEVVWNATSGVLFEEFSVISNNTATVQLLPSGVPGDALVSANIAGYEDSISINFTPSTNALAELALPAIVAEQADANVTVETLNGTVSHAFTTQTQLTVRGTPGESMSVLPGGMFTPNGSARVHFAMNSIDQEEINGQQAFTITDHRGGLKAQVWANVRHDTGNSFEGFGSSLLFEGGHLRIDPDPILDINNDLFLNIRFLPTGGNSERVLIQKGSGEQQAYLLKLVEEANELFLELTVQTDAPVTDGVQRYTFRSSIPVSENEWHIAGFKFKNNLLILALDDDRISIPVEGSLLGQGEKIDVGIGFLGNIDDIIIGRESAQDALLTIATNSVTFGNDGSATVTVQATGQDVGLGQIVGFTVAPINTVTAKAETERQELQFYNFADFKTKDKLAPYLALLGIGTAYAQEGCDRRCQRARARQRQQQGLALTNREVFGGFREMVANRLFGPEVVDAFKTTAQFLFELTSISDIFIIVKTIYYLIQGRTDSVDAFEAVFSVISVGVTVVAIVATGGAALVPLRLALTSFRGLLRSILRDIGADALLRIGTLTAREIGRLFRQFLTSPSAAARELGDLANALTNVVTSAIPGIANILLRSVRNITDFRAFIQIYRANDRIAMRLAEIAADTARFGDNAFDVERAMRSIIADTRFQTRLANYPDESLDGFAEVIAAQLRNGADVEAAAGLATRAFTRFPDEALTESLDELAMLARRMPPIQGG